MQKEEDDFEIDQIPAENQSQIRGFSSAEEVTQFNQNECTSFLESDTTQKLQVQNLQLNIISISTLASNKLPQKSEKKFKS